MSKSIFEHMTGKIFQVAASPPLEASAPSLSTKMGVLVPLLPRRATTMGAMKQKLNCQHHHDQYHYHQHHHHRQQQQQQQQQLVVSNASVGFLQICTVLQTIFISTRNSRKCRVLALEAAAGQLAACRLCTVCCTPIFGVFVAPEGSTYNTNTSITSTTRQS